MANEVCIFCNGVVVTLREKGANGINNASKERNENIVAVPGQRVHVKCRWRYCHPQEIAHSKKTQAGQSAPLRRSSLVRSAGNSFNFKTDCMYRSIENTKKKRSKEAYRVTTIEVKDNVLKICSERRDGWSEVFKARLLNVHDLPAADAVYHQSCKSNFHTGKQIPRAYNNAETSSKKPRIGRPQNTKKRKRFLPL